MIIDLTYFRNKISIPNLDSGNSTTINANDEVTNLIREYEYKYLIDVFGEAVAKEILSKVDANGDIIAGTEQKYIDLIDGNGSDWLGLRYEVNGLKYSQIANYVFCQYLRQNDTHLTSLGNTIDDVEQSTVISAWSKFNNSWREMMRQRQECYGDFWFYYENDTTKNLHEYISNSSDWDSRYFRFYENTNVLGL